MESEEEQSCDEAEPPKGPQDEDPETPNIQTIVSVLGSDESAKEALIYSYTAAYGASPPTSRLSRMQRYQVPPFVFCKTFNATNEPNSRLRPSLSLQCEDLEVPRALKSG
ncbi:putative peptidase [Corchorus capsularis]|uniref:Putative peptidase n=1 Tax=Corchorus capsularis TaxID=210143 RepID=A0A1R3JGF9_COCAP|nr:putative peptidase [Corchorus capsularis]